MDLGVLLKGELSRSGQNHYGLFVVYACLGWFVFLSLSFHITGEQKEGRIEIPYKFVLNPLSDTSFLTFSDSDSVLATLKENCKKPQTDSRASFLCPRKRELVSLEALLDHFFPLLPAIFLIHYITIGHPLSSLWAWTSWNRYSCNWPRYWCDVDHRLIIEWFYMF